MADEPPSISQRLLPSAGRMSTEPKTRPEPGEQSAPVEGAGETSTGSADGPPFNCPDCGHTMAVHHPDPALGCGLCTCAKKPQGNPDPGDIEPDEVRLQRVLAAWRPRWSIGPSRPLKEWTHHAE